jgi:hypothetical protein
MERLAIAEQPIRAEVIRQRVEKVLALDRAEGRLVAERAVDGGEMLATASNRKKISHDQAVLIRVNAG